MPAPCRPGRSLGDWERGGAGRWISGAALYDACVAGRISKDEVAHVAALARLALTDDELELFTGQLAAVLDHAADVEALDTTGVAPTAHPLSLRNVVRPDVLRASLDRDEALASAPEVEAGRFRVPPVLGETP